MENTCTWYDPSCALGWLVDEFKSFFIWVYDILLSGFAAVIEAFPVPDFLLNMQTFALPPSIAWAATALNIPFGLTVIVSAYTSRFILRRIPGIG
jgi:hypothetical protein